MRKSWLWLVLCLVLVPAALALPDLNSLNTSFTSYWDMDDNTGTTASDSKGANDGTLSLSAMWTTPQKLGASAVKFNGATYEINVGKGALKHGGAFSLSTWINGSNLNVGFMMSRDGGTTGDRDWRLSVSTNNIFFRMYNTADTSHGLLSTTGVPTGYHHIVAVYNQSGADMTIYYDGVYNNSMSFAGTARNSDVDTYIGNRALGSDQWYNSDGVDEIGYWKRPLSATEVKYLYNNGNITYYDGNQWVNGSASDEPPPSPEIDERLEQSSQLEQSGSVTTNNPAFLEILRGTFESDGSLNNYVSASIPLINPSSSNTAECRIDVNGSLHDSTTERSLTSGQDGHMTILTSNFSLGSGSFDILLECRRQGGGGSFTIENADIILHELTTSTGVSLDASYESFVSESIVSGPIVEYSFLTSENQTKSGESRFLVVDYALTYSYGATGIIGTIMEVAGVNYSLMSRYGLVGTTGSMGSLLVSDGLVNSTTYDIKLFGSGTGSLTNAKFHISEMVAHDSEFGNRSLDGFSLTSATFENIANITLTPNVGHTNGNVIVKAGVSVVSGTDGAEATFVLINGDNSSMITRGVDDGEPGIVKLQELVENVTGETTFALWGICSTADCVVNGSLSAYFTDSSPVVAPGDFVVYAHDNLTGLSVLNFSVTAFNDSLGTVSDSTVDGSLELTLNNDTVWFFEIDAFGFALSNFTTLVNASLTSHNFSLFPENSVFLTFLDEETLASITQNVTVTYSNGSDTFVMSNTSGFMLLRDLFPGLWELDVSAPGYDDRDYFVTVTSRSTQNLNVFLLNESSSVTTTFTMKKADTADVIPGAIFTLQQKIGINWVTIGQKVSDVFGTVVFDLVNNKEYRFFISADGFDTKLGEFTSTKNEYIVVLSAVAEDFISFLDDFTYVVAPDIIPAVNGTVFSLTTSSPLGRIDWFSITVLLNGTTATTNITGSPSGGTAAKFVNTTGFNREIVTAVYRIKSQSFNETLEITRSWMLLEINAGNYTMTEFMEFYANNDNGLGFASRGILLTVAAVLLAIGIGSFFGFEAAVISASGVFLVGGYYEWVHWSVLIVVVAVLIGSIVVSGGRR